MKKQQEFLLKMMKQPIETLRFTAEQIEKAVTRVYDVTPDTVGYHSKGCIYITYELHHKPNPQQVGRIANALMHLTNHKGDRVINYTTSEELIIEIHQDKCYPLQLLITY
ncbi:hypothetical protein ABID22_000108 [Pontibacter aydingkolensis]|uniref:Uncharacterized protein n=1 Tax=Pontibacter aydingkolensis TaxID=1911536 RepID=A0ABS7CQU3_9BACT|nr:hypothetical protein [Pontibacter aydingkolensis]MBW7466222.1 hypothetical protein [Pontibacter aydingkolensis]